jgi:hypothetical protein
MILRPSQCDIKELSISNNNKDNNHDITKGIMDFVQSIDIYESIYTPYITADVSVLDGANLRERLNLSGGENFKIKFLGYGNDQPLEYNLKLGEIGGIITTENLRSKSYVMRMYSSEYILNSAKTVAKSYSTSTKNIVEDILGGVLGSKNKIFVEPTKDLPVVVIPYLNPFTAISFIRQRSVSAKDVSSPVLFFENSKGYFFTTVEALFNSGGAGSSEVQTFFQREGISTNVKGPEGTISDINAHKLFANYTVRTPVDVAALLDEGGLNCVISDFDLNTKSYRRRVYSNTPKNLSVIDFVGGSNSLLTNKINEEYSPFTGKGFLIPFAKYKDTTNPTNNFMYDSLAEKYSYSNLLTQQKTYVDIPGNTKITAGSIINLSLPRHQALFNGKETNEVDSGKYLVSSVRHSINILVDSKYDTHLELIRYGRGELST